MNSISDTGVKGKLKVRRKKLQWKSMWASLGTMLLVDYILYLSWRQPFKVAITAWLIWEKRCRLHLMGHLKSMQCGAGK